MLRYTSEKIFGIRDFPLWVGYYPQPESIPPHSHDFIEMVFIAQGYAVHNFFNPDNECRTYGLIQGDVFTVMPDEKHSYEEGRNLVIYNVGLKRDLIKAELDELSALKAWPLLLSESRNSAGKVHLQLNDRLVAENCLKTIIKELTLKRPGYKLYAKAALYEFLLLVGRNSGTDKLITLSSAGQGILKTIGVMEKSPETAMSLQFLARHAGMSISHYSKKFREATGTSPMSYLIMLRLEKARALLEDKSLSIEEIADLCGFCDSNYLIRSFRSRFGVTPTKYRIF